MLITIAHQCCHSCKQAYLHSNASLRPALTEYRLIIMNHKWKQTMLLSPQNNYQLQLEIQFKQHAFELYVLYLHREKGKKQIQMEQGLPRWPCALGTTSCGTPGQPGLSARASSFRNTTNKEIRIESFTAHINRSHKAEILRRVIDGRSVLFLGRLLRDD